MNLFCGPNHFKRLRVFIFSLFGPTKKKEKIKVSDALREKTDATRIRY